MTVTLKHNGLTRLKVFSIEEIFDWIKKNPKNKYMEYETYKIKMDRIRIFRKKGIICVKCGVKGEFFALEEDKGGGIHMDLYGIIDTDEVSITIDHIIPKSKGGVNKIINYQTMCKMCNEIKSGDLF
jgi:5-methylcytosine-specific restriction endonuclease McrA